MKSGRNLNKKFIEQLCLSGLLHIWKGVRGSCVLLVWGCSLHNTIDFTLRSSFFLHEKCCIIIISLHNFLSSSIHFYLLLPMKFAKKEKEFKGKKKKILMWCEEDAVLVKNEVNSEHVCGIWLKMYCYFWVGSVTHLPNKIFPSNKQNMDWNVTTGTT